MAGSRVQKNKPHKTRFASKSSRHAHKLSEPAMKTISKGSHHNMSKGARAARLQRSKMVRDQKRAALLTEKRALNGLTSPPRILALFPLSSNVQLTKLKQTLLSAFASSDSMDIDISDNGESEAITDILCSSTCKLRSIVLEAPHGDLQLCLEMAKVADIIAFVASADVSSHGAVHNRYIDLIGSQCLSMLRALGLPSTVVEIALLLSMELRLKTRNVRPPLSMLGYPNIELPAPLWSREWIVLPTPQRCEPNWELDQT